MGLSKKGRFVYCADCGSRGEINGICKICGHEDAPLLPGMVPDIIGKTSEAAGTMLLDPECQLSIGIITTEFSETIAEGTVISCSPAVGTELAIGFTVDIVVSLGPVV